MPLKKEEERGAAMASSDSAAVRAAAAAEEVRNSTNWSKKNWKKPNAILLGNGLWPQMAVLKVLRSNLPWYLPGFRYSSIALCTLFICQSGRAEFLQKTVSKCVLWYKWIIKSVEIVLQFVVKSGDDVSASLAGELRRKIANRVRYDLSARQ